MTALPALAALAALAPVVAFALAVAGFAALALAMERHYRALFGAPPPRFRARALRTGGWALLGLSLAACIADAGREVGPVLWLGLLTAAALVVLLLLAVLPGAGARS